MGWESSYLLDWHLCSILVIEEINMKLEIGKREIDSLKGGSYTYMLLWAHLFISIYHITVFTIEP